MNRTSSNTKGFTIIEVVLVLAIAGLIFLVVFLALPALQRSQRDTQRKSDLGKFMSQVTSFQSNNQGALPGTTAANWNTFIGNYLTNSGQTFSDPSSGSTYNVSNVANAAATVPTLNPGEIRVYLNSKCGTGGVVANTGSRNYAAVIYAEQGGFSCQSN